MLILTIAVLCFFLIIQNESFCNATTTTNNCPSFTVSYDYNAMTNYVTFNDNEIFAVKLQSSPRVPLYNFQYAFPYCFPNINVTKIPLVYDTNYKNQGISYPRNPPPTKSYCQANDLFMSGNYCNQYATLSFDVTGECDKIVNPAQPVNSLLCYPPYCWSCLTGATGLGVASKQLGECYIDFITGYAMKLFACYPLLGCTDHADCAVTNYTKPSGLSYVLSVKGIPVYDNANSVVSPLTGYPCCSLLSTSQVCGFQTPLCTCNYCTTLIAIKGWAFNFVATTRKDDNILGNYKYHLKTDMCSDKIYEPFTAFYDTPPKLTDWSETSTLRYHVVQMGLSVQYQNTFEGTGGNQATVTNGRASMDENAKYCDDHDISVNKFRCVDIFSEESFTGDTARLCTNENGAAGYWGRLADVKRQKDKRATPDGPWWQQSSGGEGGDWKEHIKSLRVSSRCTKVTVYNDNYFKGNSEVYIHPFNSSSVNYFSYNVARPNVLNIRSLKIEKYC